MGRRLLSFQFPKICEEPMLKLRMLPVSLSIACALMLSHPAAADDVQTQLDAQQRSMLSLQNSLEALQGEVQGLNGRIESLEHEIAQLKETNAALKSALASKEPAAAEPADGAGGETAPKAEGAAAAAPRSETPKESASEELKPVTDEIKGNYDLAYDFIKKNDLPGAAKAFDAFIKRYPDCALTPNAWYWLGQVQYKQNSLEDARTSFLNAAKYKSSPKRADALYKLGVIHKQNGDRDKAKRFFDLVIKTYPADASATLAQKELESL